MLIIGAFRFAKCEKLRRRKRGRGGKEKRFGEKEFPPRPSDFFSEISVGIFAEKSSDFVQETQHFASQSIIPIKFMKKNQIKSLVAFLFEIGNLRKVIRAHQQTLLSFDLSDTIASHSFRVALIGYFLASQLKTDANKVLKMCLLHDLEETRSSDHNWVHKRYVKVFEEEIMEDQLKNLPTSQELLKISKEYQKRKTLEAKIAKDADLLDEIFLLREYVWQGNKEAKEWLKEGSQKSQQEKLMFTNLAKQIAKEAKKQDPSFWWENIWTPKRRK